MKFSLVLIVLNISMETITQNVSSVKPPVQLQGSIQPGEYPFVVAVFAVPKNLTCTGALVNFSKVLTAVGCVYKKKLDIVIAGEVITSPKNLFDNGQVRKVQRVIWHPDSINEDRIVTKYGLAMITVHKPFALTKEVAPINIPTAELGLHVGCKTLGFIHNLTLKDQGQLISNNFFIEHKNDINSYFLSPTKMTVAGPKINDLGSLMVNFEPKYNLHGIFTGTLVKEYHVYINTGLFTKWILEKSLEKFSDSKSVRQLFSYASRIDCATEIYLIFLIVKVLYYISVDLCNIV